MNNHLLTLTRQYEEALRNHVEEDAGEAALERACELGRRAGEAGFGILDIAAIHQQALLKVLPQSQGREEGARVVHAAGEFFLESLSPFDAAHRGLRSANATVLMLNESLDERKRIELEIRRMNDELRTARDTAVQASRAKSAFLANMSHELRTPLNAIIGYAEMLQDEAHDIGSDATATDLGKIQGAARHLLDLINEILDFAKIEAGKVKVHMQTVDLSSLVREAVATVQTLAEKNRNCLLSQVEPGLEWMRADETKLRQVMFNLLSNACKFTTDGQIHVTVRREPASAPDSLPTAPANAQGWIMFQVCDTGVGMSPDQMLHLFEEFYQAHTHPGCPDYGGTGLGLAISRRYVEMMGGNIRAESDNGHGSTFTIRLPDMPIGEAEAEAITNYEL